VKINNWIYLQLLQKNTFRDFIENHLVDFAKENPGIVVYVKPRRHRTPVLVGEYCEYKQTGK